MTQQSEDRLDRIERNLDQTAEQQKITERAIANFSKEVTRSHLQIHNHMDRINKEANEGLNQTRELIANNARQIAETDKQIANNALQSAKTDQQIAQLSQEISLLRAAVQSHVSEPTPPAHSD